MNPRYIFFPLILVFSLILSNPIFAQSPVPDDAEVQRLADGFELSEGPYWHPDGYLLFSDVSESIIYMWTEENGLETFMDPTGESNGITADLYGNVVIAQHDDRQVGMLDLDTKTITPLATHYNGDRLNSPNDLVVKSDGAIFFTDPPWGQNLRPQDRMDFHGVYRISPTDGSVQLLIDDLDYPNGIAFSPDESKLYVTETLNSYIHVYDVVDDSTLANGRVFAIAREHGNNSQNGADGIKVDNDGNVWAVGSDGVVIFDPNGDVLDIIVVPGRDTTNLNWGGTDNLKLFITNFEGLFVIDLGPLQRPASPTNLQTTTDGNSITLTWEHSCESIKNITVYRSSDGESFEKIHASACTDSFTDSDVQASAEYTYKVTVTDVMGFESDMKDDVETETTGTEESLNHIDRLELQQNYPNPFNPTTNIAFTLQKSENVSLNVYNVYGELVDKILNQPLSAGSHRIEWNGSGFSTGLYVYTLETAHSRISRKMLLIK